MEVILLSKNRMKLNWILLDSFREDYLKHTPFLAELAKGNLSKLEPVAGYQQYLASFFTGKKPDEIDVWSIFRYSPETSLFKWARFLPASIFDMKLPKYGVDFLSYLMRGTSDMSKVQIPHRLMKYFDLGMNSTITEPGCLSVPTVFDNFRKNNVSFSYVKGLMKSEGKDSVFRNFRHYLFNSDEKTIALARKSNAEVLFTYLVQLDGIGHRYGPSSMEVREHLRKIDSLLEDFLPKNVPFLIHSDHGMVEVNKSIDLWKQLDELGLEQGKDFLFFLDSVIARFWFFNKKAEEAVIDLLKKTEGRILRKLDLVKYGLNFRDNRFGDLIFFAPYGKMLSPNFWQDRPCKGMHGYLPEKDEYGVLMTKLAMPKNPGYRDIYPIVKKTFGER